MSHFPTSPRHVLLSSVLHAIPTKCLALCALCTTLSVFGLDDAKIFKVGFEQ